MTDTPTPPAMTPEQRAELVVRLRDDFYGEAETVADQLEADGVTIAALTAERDALEDSVVRLIAENFALSAWQCVFHDGRTGLVNDEYGNQYCAMQQKGAAT